MSTNQYVIKSAHRTLEVLLAFANPPHRYGLADLQQVTGWEKNRLYRSLKTLEAAGYLQIDAAGQYTLTELVSSLVAAVPAEPGTKPTRRRRNRLSGPASVESLASD
jgi:hypothetical protein